MDERKKNTDGGFEVKAVVQRVSRATLRVNGETVSEIDVGLCVYLGVERGDLPAQADALAKKIAKLRIFEDEAGKLNRSALDCGLEVLAISNFTLCADCAHGNRPSFIGAEAPESANALYVRFCEELSGLGIRVSRGVFGADMKIEQVNDGPVTIVL